MTKYGARRTEHAGRVYASKAEARRAVELQLLERAGEIRDLEYQPAFDLVVNGVKIGRYVADFRYLRSRFLPDWTDDRGRRVGVTLWDVVVVEDVKGVATPVYRLKKKLVQAIHGIEIQEVAA